MTALNDTYFQFEADFVASLRCIPMQVRYKLDTCGVKLKLHHWNQFSTEERQQLVDMPCNTEGAIAHYHDHLQALVTQHAGAPAGELPIDPAPPWMDIAQIPPTVQAKLEEVDGTLSLNQWQTLNPIQRFALIKLSRPSHENRNFVPALREFGLS
ncbi:MAG: nitrate reductase associated protein [Cyanobacteria bacterium J06638_20]